MCYQSHILPVIKYTMYVLATAPLSYMLIPTTADVNECMLEKTDCSPNAECENRVGSYVCHCLNGYEGDGFICTGKGTIGKLIFEL